MDNKKYESEMSNIKGIVDQRYSEEFNIEYFLPAKDKTYDNILTLSNENGILFNAYQNNEGEVSDDYLEALVNIKLSDYIVSSSDLSSELKLVVLGILKDGSVLTVDFANNYVPSPSNKDFIKIVTVIAMDDEIAQYKNELFNVYNNVLMFESDLIEFEVISYTEPSDELSKALTNPLGYYNNNWNDYKEVKSYIDVTSKNITSADELVKEVK